MVTIFFKIGHHNHSIPIRFAGFDDIPVFVVDGFCYCENISCV